MTEPRIDRVKRIHNHRTAEPEQRLAAAVLAFAIDDARHDPEALAFIGGAGSAPFWFSIVTPADRDVEDIMSMARRAVGA